MGCLEVSGATELQVYEDHMVMFLSVFSVFWKFRGKVGCHVFRVLQFPYKVGHMMQAV